MSRFGWAYVSTLLTGAVANGPTNSIQFNSGSQVLSGSSNFTFDPLTNTVYLTGTLRADTLIVSASQILKSGSTIFGDSSGDTHQFTGSMFISNTLSASSNIQGGGTLTIAGATTLSGNTDIYAITQVRNSSLNMVSGSTIKSSFDTNGNLSGSGQLQVGTDIILGNNLTMNGPLFTSAGEIRVKNQIIKTTDTAGTTTKAYLDNNGDVSGSRNFIVGSDITAGGSYFGSGGIKGGYSTYNINFNVPKASYFVGISSIGGAITASLDSATQYQAGQTLIFKDTGGAAGTNNILIRPSGSQTIDGASGGILITTNSGSITLISNGTNQFYIVASR